MRSRTGWHRISSPGHKAPVASFPRIAGIHVSLRPWTGLPWSPSKPPTSTPSSPAPPAADCRIVIEAGDLRRNAPLRERCEKSPLAAAIACYADGDRELARLIDDELRAAGLTIAADARALLASLIGGDRRASRNE